MIIETLVTQVATINALTAETVMAIVRMALMM
jgi:hypothetical protein